DWCGVDIIGEFIYDRPLCGAIQENGCFVGKKSDVWKLYVFAGSDVGNVTEQSTVELNRNFYL
ncbi:MAG: hypothetical protein ABL876_16825, partial [Chitinophagaceae bacterium]